MSGSAKFGNGAFHGIDISALRLFPPKTQILGSNSIGCFRDTDFVAASDIAIAVVCDIAMTLVCVDPN